MFDSVKKLVGISTAHASVELTGINLPWHLARYDAAGQQLLPLFRMHIFEQPHQERIEYYTKLFQMVSDMIESMDQVNLFYLKFQRQQKTDSMQSPLQIIHSAIGILKGYAVLAYEISKQDSDPQALTPDALLKLRVMEDTSADAEINLLHNVSETLEAVSFAVQKNSENRKRQLNKADMERYNRAFTELTRYYESR